MLPMTLDTFRPGQDFIINGLTASGEIRKRLLDMGFIHGARGKVLRKALLGDPIELRLGTYLVSLRLKEARTIQVSAS